MAQIISASNFSSASLGAPGTFVVNEPPPPIAVGATANTGGVVGTASWGPLNTPVLLGSYNQATSAFGPVTAAAVSGGASGGADLHDLATDLLLAFNQAQAQGVSIGLWGVRVSDGTDTAASVTLMDTSTPTPATGGTLTALYTGSLGSQIQVNLSAGSAANTITAKLQGFNSGYIEVFPNIFAGTAGAFWANFASALANGITSVRGPSQLARFTVASSTKPPAIGTFALTGGTDGRSAITTAQLTGSNASYPYTGAYALQNLQPAVTVFWIAGLTDNSAYANMLTLASGMPAAFPVTFPTGTDSATAVTDLSGYGIANYQILPIKDWIYFFDSVNNVTRLIPPLPIYMGLLLTLSPSVSPLNKPVYGVVGTERNNPLTGVNLPYSYAELSELQAAGIQVIDSPSAGGNYFGCQIGTNAVGSGNAVESPVEFTRTTNYLSGWIASNSGQFQGQNQSPLKGDPLRARVRAAFNSGIANLVKTGIIAAGSVQCDIENNPQTSVAAHILTAYFLFTYLSSVWYFVAQVTGGTTVVTSGSTLTSALQAQGLS